ncbi:hypothetical protein GGI07_002241 [Coemansia sp. Benny D115]|nr:hypothetical protein GGI07_002241 [Coemansia sp. Benny D115]
MEPTSRAEEHTAVVLDEDEFRERVSQIVARDFFPDLERLRAANEALATGTAVLAVHHPKTDEQPAEDAEHQGLDGFLDTHVSEDTASFKRLLEEENQQRRDAYQRIHGQKLLLTHSDRKDAEGQRALALALEPPSTARNALIFGPADMPPPARKKAPDSASSTAASGRSGSDSSSKQIVHRNTRFPDNWHGSATGVFCAEDDFADTVSEVGSEASTAGYSTPVIRGYRMISEPDSSRRRTKRKVGGRSRGFEIRPQTPRERIAARMAEEKGAGGGVMGGGTVPGLLSPAAQRLLLSQSRRSTNRQNSGSPAPGPSSARQNSGDNALRSAYNSPYAFRPL